MTANSQASPREDQHAFGVACFVEPHAEFLPSFDVSGFDERNELSHLEMNRRVLGYRETVFSGCLAIPADLRIFGHDVR